MTYPPHGQGQPGGWQAPAHQQSGYPQQHQQQYQQSQFQQPFQQPSPRRGGRGKTAAIVAAVVVVLALAAVAITGFWAPGFLVADDGARPVAEDVVDGINGRDTAALQELTCDDATDYVTSTIDDLEGRFPGQTTLEQFDETPDDAKALVRAAVDESGYTEYTVDLDPAGGGWCWKGLTKSGYATG